MSVLSTIGSILTGGASSTISSDVATAERYATIAYSILAFEIALLIFIAAGISKKVS